MNWYKPFNLIDFIKEKPDDIESIADKIEGVKPMTDLVFYEDKIVIENGKQIRIMKLTEDSLFTWKIIGGNYDGDVESTETPESSTNTD